MISIIKKIFTDHWHRKLISLILAIIIWFLTNQSITTTKVISSIPVKVKNLPEGKTIEGMLENGILDTKINLSITGNKDSLEDLSHKNLEVVIDASGQPDQWIANIDKKNLICSIPGFDLNQAVVKVSSPEMIIKQTKLVSEKVPILITQPIGEAPKGYQFLDVWPYKLFLSVTGPEDVVNKIKTRGIKLTFNLNEISKNDLDAISSKSNSDEISFPVPALWKKVSVPQISDQTIEIDDPQASNLRIDFSKQDFMMVGNNIPITVFFPAKHSATLNPETYSIGTNDLILKKNGVKVLSMPLYTQGMSRLFLDIVKDMIQITVIASPKSERDTLLWSAQFINPHELENRYVAKVISESPDTGLDVLPLLKEEYIRNRFRRYMNRFRFFTENHQKLSLKIKLLANSISVVPNNSSFVAENEFEEHE